MDQFFLFPIDEESTHAAGRSLREDEEPGTSAVSQPEDTEDNVFPNSPSRRSSTSSTGSAMKPPPSSPTSPTQASVPGALPPRSRRWSLDVISPLRLLVAPHSSSSKRPVTPEVESDETSPIFAATIPPLGERRYSQPVIPKVKAVKNKTVKVKDGGSKKDGKVKESYMLVTLDTGQTIVLSCKDDDRHLKQLISVAMMDRRVLSYRMIVASSRGVLKGGHGGGAVGVNERKVRSCEDLLEVLSEPDELWERAESQDTLQATTVPCRRREILQEMARTERDYYDNLQAVFDAYAEPLRKFSSLTAEEHRILFMSMEPILSLTASLVNKLETALNTWDTQNTRLGNLFSNTFWNYYKDFSEGYSQIKSVFLDKQRSDTAFEEFCDLRHRQGRLSLEALLASPISVHLGMGFRLPASIRSSPANSMMTPNPGNPETLIGGSSADGDLCTIDNISHLKSEWRNKKLRARE
ncbi:rho GTPase-activating protein [Plakobranchus ocellatus]|uniref:Rho GTPase-activating protein n=1 Tax=Plakobranchus ocellatus TaxID=259542 RepID=A0AAV3Z9S0_9GAST|nr:rho GTPase-activating protein [Plakobranchus ocellatus]